MSQRLHPGDESGFSLVEVLVGVALLGVVLTGLAYGLIASLGITQDSRERTIAANLASAEIDRALAVPPSQLQEGDLPLRTETVGTTTFTVLRESRWTQGTTQAQHCTALGHSTVGRGRKFLEVNVTVRWNGLGLGAPVRASTAITPSVASYRDGFGHVAVTVTRRDGSPFGGVAVTLQGPGVNRIETTSTSIGCAFFTDVPAGSYTVRVNQAGHVDEEDRQQLGIEDVTVVPRDTSSAAFVYDQAASLTLTVAGAFGGAVPDGVLASAAANAPAPFFLDSPAGSGSAVRTLAPVFPYTGGWTARAGCDHNRPERFGGASTPLSPGPGAGASGTVTAGTLRMQAVIAQASRAGQTAYALDAEGGGTSCAAAIALGTFTASGTFSADVVLPFGDWRLYAGMTQLTPAATPIQVRPQARAQYVETVPPPSLPYFDTVRADAPFFYHRLDDAPGGIARDSSGFGRTGTYRGAVRTDVAGPLTMEQQPGIGFDGVNDGGVTSTNTFVNPSVFSIEVWFRTASTTGGPLVGFNDLPTGTGGNRDRFLYLLNSGQVVFGVYSGSSTTITSPAAYNNNAWHHAVATLSSAGMRLYVDGALVVSLATVTTAQNITGYWRLGHNDLQWWPGTHNDNRISAEVDEFAYYPSALTPTRVAAHYSARTGTGYATAVQADNPALFWRLNESKFAADASGNNRTGNYFTGLTGGATSALLNDANTGIALNGTTEAYMVNPVPVANPQTFSVEIWFRTSSTTGGKLITFGNALSGPSPQYDRHLYLGPNGQLSFGTYSGGRTVIQSTGTYRDGQWHHAVATRGGTSGLSLYVDGVRVANNPAPPPAENITGYWRVGYDNVGLWANAPTTPGLTGDVDEFAVYTTELSAARVAEHYRSSGRSLP